LRGRRGKVALDFGIPLTTVHPTARRFVAALDAEDYDAVRAALAPNCVYHAPEGTLVGPDRILSSYRAQGAAARHRFEKIEYASALEAIGPGDAIVTFIDRLMLAGAWHEFQCRQRIRIGSADLVDEIWHEEIPGERERLQEFEAGSE